MRHLPKYLKMLLMDCSLTKKLSPKCCFDMLCLVPSSQRDCSYQHISTQLVELQKTELELRCTDPALLKLWMLILLQQMESFMPSTL